MHITICACGCGGEMDAFDNRKRQRKYIRNHQNKEKSKAQIRAAIKSIKANRPRVPWNKGKSYTISKRVEYANKGAWNMAMRRMYPDRCMRCGWGEASCDTHHIIPKSKGGKFTLDNGVILCPNCHRLVHCELLQTSELVAIKRQAVPVNPSV